MTCRGVRAFIDWLAGSIWRNICSSFSVRLTLKPPPMQHRTLGNSGLSFKPLVLGGNVFDWTADVPTSLSIISAFVERGFAAIDTADVYSTWVKGIRAANPKASSANGCSAAARDKIIIVTKVGMPMKSAGKGLSQLAYHRLGGGIACAGSTPTTSTSIRRIWTMLRRRSKRRSTLSRP